MLLVMRDTLAPESNSTLPFWLLDPLATSTRDVGKRAASKISAGGLRTTVLVGVTTSLTVPCAILCDAFCCIFYM